MKRYCRFAIWLTCVFFLVVIVGGCSSKKNKPAVKSSCPAEAEANAIVEDRAELNCPQEVLPLFDVNEQTANVLQTEESSEPCEVLVSIETVSKELSRTSDSEKKIELLESLFDNASRQDPCVIDIVQKEVSNNDGNAALAAIALLQGYESPAALPAIAEAMRHSSDEVRLTAVSLLSDINDPQIGGLLTSALSDESEDVRSIALDAIGHKDKEFQYEALRTAISSPYSDVKEEAVFALQFTGGTEAVDILIEALRDKDAEFREKATSAIDSLLEKEFTSYKEAKDWWHKNKDKYDEDLNLIEEGQETLSD